MSYSSPTRYEFTAEQNDLIGNLAKKMRLVGLVGIVVGLLNLLSALLLLVFIFQDKLPSEIVQRIEEAKIKLPPTDFLWGILMQGVTVGLFFLLIGVWTRSSAGSFRQVVDTAGHDVGHLMNALASLRKMYSLMYTLIVFALIFSLVSLGLQLYMRYMHK